MSLRYDVEVLLVADSRSRPSERTIHRILAEALRDHGLDVDLVAVSDRPWGWCDVCGEREEDPVLTLAGRVLCIACSRLQAGTA
jgi:hypothetical protein